MASVSGIFFFRLALLDRAQLVTKGVEFDADGVLAGQLLVRVALLLDELGSDFGGTQSGVEALRLERRVGLALPVNEHLDVFQEMGQVVLGGFTTARGDVIFYRLAGFEFAEAFADRGAIPTEFALGSALSAIAEGFDDLGHKQASVTAFEFLGGVDAEGLELVGQVHRRSGSG